MSGRLVRGENHHFNLGAPCSLLELYHKWLATQYSADNCFNVNNDGNINANNKYNELTVVPFAELDRMMKEGGYIVPLGSVWDAYYDCIKDKRTTMNAMLFSANVERNVKALWREINSGSYQIGRSISFIVEKPVKREIFAADFRDRVVHHWICLRLVPLFEEFLSPRMFSNRKGKGTLGAIHCVRDDIMAVSEGYRKDCWIWKFDLKGFFMSIDKRILNARLQEFIDDKYFADDKDVLKSLVEKVVLHCPQTNCVRRSSLESWKGLRSDKSLFSQDRYHGLAIGNLTSQLFANFYLSAAVRFLNENGFKHVTQYVDDVVVVHPSKDEITAFIPKMREFLMNDLGITLHPNKCYIQHYSKGVAFVGGIIKPHRLYISKRSRRRMFAKLHWISINNFAPSEVLDSVNSYLGLTRHFRNYKLRLKAAGILFAKYHRAIMFNNNCEKMIISKAYAPCQ